MPPPCTHTHVQQVQRRVLQWKEVVEVAPFAWNARMAPQTLLIEVMVKDQGRIEKKCVRMRCRKVVGVGVGDGVGGGEVEAG